VRMFKAWAKGDIPKLSASWNRTARVLFLKPWL